MKHNAITSLSDLKPIHVSKWLKLLESFSEDKYNQLLENLNFRVQLVSIFLDMSLSQARRIDVNNIIEISDHYIGLMGTFKHEDPKCKVSINGKNYVSQINYGSWTTGQMIDVKILKADDFYLHPERFLAIMYIEEGLAYCQEDKHQIVMNPNAEREKIFKDHFPGDELWRWYAFFLRNYSSWRLAIMGIQTARIRIQTQKLERETTKIRLAMRPRNGFYLRLRLSTWRKIWASKLRK